MDEDLDNRNDEAACGKLWEIYVKEAQQYDEGMIRSWKEDMDNMLVFSGLYSAILTAFVIESYQNLQPDPTEDSSALLRRITEQLASSPTLPPIPDPSSFTPTTAALACNILWFTSLSLALTCSFLATLVQQWSRRFLHRTSTVRSPGVHAHLLQFLYFGLKDLKMHAVVDMIPSLLHLSLFSFFAGLIGFLHDVNAVLTRIAIAVFSLVLLVYVILTVLPLFKLDSPYATPLSSLLWRLLQVWRIIRTLIPRPSKSSFNRFLRSIISPNDEEAQRRLYPPRRINLSWIEWNIVDATVQASRIRRIEHESRSILWSLRSLNDDSELLPFVEALPDVLQFEETSDKFRETNFHLLEALVASTDPQVNIILRILDLMEDARYAWHTKAHQQRCQIACARALYTLGHIFCTNRVRFRRMTHETPIFPTELINRIGEGLCDGSLDIAYGQSALVLCALSSCLWVGGRVASERVNTLPYVSLIRQASVIGKMGWQYNVWKRISMEYTRYNHINPTPSRTVKDVIDGTVAHLLLEYTLEGIRCYPKHFEYISMLIIGTRTEGLASHFHCGVVFNSLRQALNLRRFEQSDRDKVDNILLVAMRVAASRDHTTELGGNTPVSLDRLISACISSYHQTFGWGCPSVLRDYDTRWEMLKCLQLQKGYPRPLEEAYLVCLKHLLVYTDRREKGVYLFWADIYRDIHRKLRKQSSQELSLAYLITLQVSALALARWMGPGRMELETLSYQIYEKVSADKVYRNASKDHLHWITLLQCLGSHLPISHILDVLKFFHSLRMDGFKTREVVFNIAFLTRFACQSEDYYCKLANCLQSELERLLELNGMIWAFGETWIYGAISPEMRQATEAILVQPYSYKNPSSTILCDHRHRGDGRKHLDLPANIEATKEHFNQYRHLFTAIPDVDVEEERLLAMSDHTYSDYLHRDRLAEHYFVPLPPSDDEEDDALQHPADDPTYVHMQSTREWVDKRSYTPPPPTIWLIR